MNVLDLFSAAAGFRTVAACEVIDWRRAADHLQLDEAA